MLDNNSGITALATRTRASRVSITFELAIGDTARDYSADGLQVREVSIPGQLEQRRSYEVCLGVVIIHVAGTGQQEERRRPIIDSGLFGLFGEKKVQVVGARDHVKLRQFAMFNEAYGSPQDVRAACFFQGYPTDDLQKHMHRVELEWLEHRWKDAKKSGTAIKDCRTAWARWDGFQYPWPNFAEPNRDHPWVKSVLHAMPEFRPAYMIHLCTSRCT